MSAAFAIVTDEVSVCGAVQSWFTLKYATDDGSTVLGIPDTMFTPAKLVMPEPFPEMIPLLTTRFEETVTLDIKVWPAVQVLVLDNNVEAGDDTHCGVLPGPWLDNR